MGKSTAVFNLSPSLTCEQKSCLQSTILRFGPSLPSSSSSSREHSVVTLLMSTWAMAWMQFFKTNWRPLSTYSSNSSSRYVLTASGSYWHKQTDGKNYEKAGTKSYKNGWNFSVHEDKVSRINCAESKEIFQKVTQKIRQEWDWFKRKQKSAKTVVWSKEAAGQAKSQRVQMESWGETWPNFLPCSVESLFISSSRLMLQVSIKFDDAVSVCADVLQAVPPQKEDFLVFSDQKHVTQSIPH